MLRIEIRTPAGELQAKQTFPAARIEPHVPLCLEFAPLQSAGPRQLNIFADDVDVPFYLLEWRKYRFGGLGRTHSRAFCGLLF